MAKKGIIFTDIDGTLGFHQGFHNIEEIKANGDGTVMVMNRKSGTTHTAYDISTKFYKVYFGIDTRRLCQQASKKYAFVCVSGVRKSSMDSRWKVMDFADAFILEGGGLILDKNGQEDREWSLLHKPSIPYLQSTIRQLQQDGWNLDIEGRAVGIRIRKEDNPHKPASEFDNLRYTLKLPSQLKITMNLKHWDIIPVSAGKGNAMEYIADKMGYKLSQATAIGDDENDLEMLQLAGQRFVLGSSFPSVIKKAMQEGWYVSQGLHFNGINEILGRIISL